MFGGGMLNKDEKYYRNITAAAGLLHDMGKLVRRADEKSK
jgi:HD superfamily phosphodiesterase